jgi:hypothetical protein
MPPTVRGERTNNLIIDDDGLGPPTVEGQVRNDGSDLKVFIGGSVKSLTTGSGISEPAHRALDQLVHAIAETSYLELVRTSGQVSDVIHWTDNGKTQKIRETNITRTAGQVSQIVVKQYDGAGVLAETLTGTVSRTGGQVDNIEWVLT